LSSTSNAFLGEQKNNGIAHSQSYSIVETSHGKNRLKEYVSNSGQVFAVTWSGYSHPDLSEILGSYWSEYNTAIKKHKPNHFEKHFTQSTKNIVIEKSGHFRSVKGRAYILKLLPAGVNLNAIE
jgi:hypothetical protein